MEEFLCYLEASNADPKWLFAIIRKHYSKSHTQTQCPVVKGTLYGPTNIGWEEYFCYLFHPQPDTAYDLESLNNMNGKYNNNYYIIECSHTPHNKFQCRS